jgi:hypothetical protein
MLTAKIPLDTKSDVLKIKSKLKSHAYKLLRSKITDCETIANLRISSELNNHTADSVEKELITKLDKWIEQLISLCGHGIEINGEDYHQVLNAPDKRTILNLIQG